MRRQHCNMVVLALLLSISTSVARQVRGQGIFWTDALRQEIWTAELSGYNPHVIVTNLPAVPESIAVDPIGHKVYWTLDGQVNLIQRANWNGSKQETVLDDGDGPNAIAVDVAGRKLYFGSEDSQSIRRIDLDGSNPEFLLDSPDVSSLGVDAIDKTLYWAAENNSEVFRANLDGTNPSLFLSGPAPGANFGNLQGVIVDPLSHTLYLNDEDDSRIYIMPLPDGSLTHVVPAGVLHPRNLALDVNGRQFFWTQDGGIYRSGLDGSGSEQIVSWLTQDLGYFPQAIAVVPEPSSLIEAGVALLVTFSIHRSACRRCRGRVVTAQQ
jgi:DNA-binding beta-propeller fold protein YncE